MKRENRILKKQEFASLWKNDKKFYSQNFIANFNNNSKIFHLGVSISKKVLKLAVKRNKLKRQIKAIVYQIYKENNINKIEVVLIAKKGIEKYSFQELKLELNQLFKKIM